MYIDIKIDKKTLKIETDANEYTGFSCIEALEAINAILGAVTISETLKPEAFYSVGTNIERRDK